MSVCGVEVRVGGGLILRPLWLSLPLFVERAHHQMLLLNRHIPMLPPRNSCFLLGFSLSQGKRGSHFGGLGRGMSVAADRGCRHLKQAGSSRLGPLAKHQISPSPIQLSQNTTTVLSGLALTPSPGAATPNFRDKVMYRLYIISRHYLPISLTCRSDSHVSGAAAVLCRSWRFDDVLGESGKVASGPTALRLLKSKS
jgi:hypothetical protein